VLHVVDAGLFDTPVDGTLVSVLAAQLVLAGVEKWVAGIHGTVVAVVAE
jgi:hypothetical protein